MLTSSSPSTSPSPIVIGLSALARTGSRSKFSSSAVKRLTACSWSAPARSGRTAGEIGLVGLVGAFDTLSMLLELAPDVEEEAATGASDNNPPTRSLRLSAALRPAVIEYTLPVGLRGPWLWF